MADQDSRPTQQTRPKKGKPIEIPVPKREDFDKLIRRAASRKESAQTPRKRQS